MDETAVEIRPMRREDIPAGLELSRAAGWNQTEADWSLLLEGESGGGLVACSQGSLVGTVTVISYPDWFHWLGMMLVAADYQRQGIGQALMTAALGLVGEPGTVFLDATPAGKKLYDSLGFQEVYSLARCLRQQGALPGRPDSSVTPISTKIFPNLIQYDLAIFGADRSKILAELFGRAPQLAFYKEENGAISGYCLGRGGSLYTQIGPVIANNPETAQALLLCALQNCEREDVIVDTTTHQPDWNRFLVRLGFRELRPFTRMRLGNFEFPGTHRRQLAIAGPEMG